MSALLHEENFRRIPIAGGMLRTLLLKRISALKTDLKDRTDPDVSIVIRTKNDMAALPQLLDDIRAQQFDGKVEILIVDTESTDGMVAFARSQDIQVVSIRQDDFTYPKALNMGFAAARYDYVLSLVGHSSLSSTYMLKSLTRWCGMENFGGMYGLPLPSRQASVWEKISGALWLPIPMTRPALIKKSRPGLLGANTSIVNRVAWKQLGGYDERYAGGGEDTALGRSMIAAGMVVIYDPICSVFHSHGLGPINMLRQIKHWNEVATDKPHAFDASRILARRPDLRQKEKP